MNLFIYLLIINIEFILQLAILPFQVNQINILNKKYSSTELINLLFETEIYIPIKLGQEKKDTFGILSFDDYHPILTESNCEKMKLFQRNKNINKKGYIIANSKSSILLGNGTKYRNRFEYVEIYSEYFCYYNNTLIEGNKDNNLQMTELIIVKDNSTKASNGEMCLSLGLGKNERTFIHPEPPQFIDDLYNQRKIEKRFWTLKFTEQNNGLLIIGNKPDEYENNTLKYKPENYSEIYSESFLTTFRIWAIIMKEIYFYNSTKDRIIVNENKNNECTILFNFGFIIGSKEYQKLIYENYFEDLINKKICVLEVSEKTIYNSSNYYIDTNGSYLMFICDKKKMNNYIKDFPPLYFSHIDFNYIFELTYKDLFMNIGNYYYFMIIFPNNNNTNEKYKQKWFIGLPFLRQYQFIFNSYERRIGFYGVKNFEEKEQNKKKGEENKKSKIWVYFLQISIVILLILASIYIGMLLNKQRKKRANELKDDDYEYVEEENNNDMNKNKLIN